MKLKLYEINTNYISYLRTYEPHLFFNKEESKLNYRKYIGIVLEINDFQYFAPLSSFKDKHKKMKEKVDFIKLKDYAVINLNNMFPVPQSEYKYVDVSKEKNLQYRVLLMAEYRVVQVLQKRIIKNAEIVYKHKILNGNNTSLSKRCNDFKVLEKACQMYL